MFGKMIRENGLEKMETIILKCNLFRIYWERSVAFIYSYSSLIYSRVTHKISTRINLGPTEYLEENILDPRRHNGTRSMRLTRNLAHSKYSNYLIICCN